MNVSATIALSVSPLRLSILHLAINGSPSRLDCTDRCPKGLDRIHQTVSQSRQNAYRSRYHHLDTISNLVSAKCKKAKVYHYSSCLCQKNAVLAQCGL